MATEGTTLKKRVVVVGGGVAGALLVKSLQLHANVVLIDPKEYFEIPWANLRSTVEPSFGERMVINHKEYFKNGKIVTSSAVNVNEEEVVTSDGRVITYDYLVIATGHLDSLPKNRIDRLKQFYADNKKIESGNSILIIGGGPTGVELAGEIVADFPEKQVTLVHNGPRLLEFIGLKASKKAFDWLVSKNVEVLLDQSITLESESDAGNAYKTSKGETIIADFHFTCTGRPMASSWMKGTILNECLNSNGRLMVDENLKVKGQNNIFAIGDITDVPEIKQGRFAQRHALVVAKNLKMLIKGGKESKMAVYKAGTDTAMVSLGRKNAVAQFPIKTVTGFLPRMIKSKDLFVGKTRRQLGLDS